MQLLFMLTMNVCRPLMRLGCWRRYITVDSSIAANPSSFREAIQRYFDHFPTSASETNQDNHDRLATCEVVAFFTNATADVEKSLGPRKLSIILWNSRVSKQVTLIPPISKAFDD
jgi:hypothetical protein